MAHLVRQHQSALHSFLPRHLRLRALSFSVRNRPAEEYPVRIRRHATFLRRIVPHHIGCVFVELVGRREVDGAFLQSLEYVACRHFLLALVVPKEGLVVALPDYAVDRVPVEIDSARGGGHVDEVLLCHSSNLLSYMSYGDG